MLDPHPGSRPADHRDRSLGLALFGIVEILAGLGCAALVPLTLAALALSPAVATAVVIPSLVLYGVIAVLLVVLGVGSIRALPWARALSLSLAWVWLITGVCSVVAAAWLLPVIWSQAGAGAGLEPGAIRVVAVVTGLILGLLFVALPAAMVLFYRSPDVVATCRAHHPEPDPISSCPQPLLALAVAYVLGGLGVVVVPAYDFAFPLFGAVLTGAAGAAGWLVVLGLSAALAWGTCRRERWAWWTAVAATVAGGLSSALTAAGLELDELARLTRLGADQRALLEPIWPDPPWLRAAIQIVVWGSLLLYLGSVRGLFVGRHGPDEADR